MTPPELPDDPRNWPEDPFALLGVERGADDLAIRRAYTSLIRRFKPEHFPEQFRKIRAAYEQCQSQASWYRYEATTPTMVPVPHTEAPVLLPNSVDRLWTLATDGNLAEAYSGLVVQASNGESNSETCLRLYWLLSLEPKLDAGRTRHDWLKAALTRARLTGPALELYRRELEIDPQAGVVVTRQDWQSGAFANARLVQPPVDSHTESIDAYHELLNDEAPTEQRIAVARLRIVAAARSGRYSRIEQDLKLVKNRIGLDSDTAWLGLLVTAHDWAAWDQPNMLMPFLRQELGSLKQLELQHSYSFDRIDQAAYWGGEVAQVLLPQLKPFFRVLGSLWASYHNIPKSELILRLQPIAKEPMRYLDWFDDLLHTRGPNLGLLAIDLLESCNRGSREKYPADVLRGLVRSEYGRGNISRRDFRLRLLQTTIAHSIDPVELTEACAVDPESRYRDIGTYLREDLSLRIVWLATMLAS